MAWVVPAHALDNYAMDPAHCIPVFEFKHLGLTTQTGRFDKVQGTITLDRDAKVGSVTYNVETDSLNMGFGTATSNSPGYHLFGVVKFPKIRFVSDELFFDDEKNVVAAAGKHTLLGITKPVTVWVNHFKCAVNPMIQKLMCAGNITATVKRSEFGMLSFIPAISDEIKINVPIEAYKTE